MGLAVAFEEPVKIVFHQPDDLHATETTCLLLRWWVDEQHTA